MSFYPFAQDEYLSVVHQWLVALKVDVSDFEAIKPAALLWALERGSRSGRVAYQFAKDYSAQF